MTKTSDHNWTPVVSGHDYGAGTRIKIESDAYIDVESGGEYRFAAVALTTSFTELNYFDGVDASITTKLYNAPTFNIGAEAANSINVSVSLNDITGTAIATSRVVECYLSDSATGDGIAVTAPDGDVAIGTDGTILTEHVADKMFKVWTESDGDFDFDIGESGIDTWYLVVILNEVPHVSGAITFA